MSSLGIYFGPKIIGLVETKGNKVLNHINIPLVTVSGDLEEKVPEEVKIVALIKEELRKNKIDAAEATLTLSGRDLIIRTFEMPILPAAELQNAVNFEARKYIPFKVEDLITDFQLKPDKATRKNLALFVGIKKEALEKYLSILSQLDIKVGALEYCGFSVLRLLKLAGISDKGIITVIDADLQEDDEVNFTVLEDGFPLFSRDITLASESQGLPINIEEQVSGMMLEKLKTETRISLDYYHRKFPAKNIERVFFVSPQDFQGDLEAFIKDMGLSVQFIDVSKIGGKPVSFSLSFIKGYSASISSVIKTGLKINLLAAKAKIKPPEGISVQPTAALLLKGLKVEPKIIISAVLICVSVFVFGLYRQLPLQKELKDLINRQPQISASTYEELTAISAQYNQKIKTLDNLIKQQLRLTEPLDIIPRILPAGVWLENFNFKSSKEGIREGGKTELTLKGVVYLADSQKEFEAVNAFLAALKEDPVFAKYPKEISLISINQELAGETMLTRFTISCQIYQERR